MEKYNLEKELSELLLKFNNDDIKLILKNTDKVIEIYKKMTNK